MYTNRYACKHVSTPALICPLIVVYAVPYVALPHLRTFGGHRHAPIAAVGVDSWGDLAKLALSSLFQSLPFTMFQAFQLHTQVR